MRQRFTRHRPIVWLIGLTMVIALSCTDALALPPSWDRCLQREAQHLHLPADLLRALVYTESRNHPFAMAWTDRMGQRHSMYPNTVHEARQLMTRLLRRHQRFDAGLGQVNSIHHFRVHHPSDLLAPCTNLHVAGLVLRENLDRHGYTWQALAGYNGSVGSTNYIELVHQNLCRQPNPWCDGSSLTIRTHPAPTDPLPTHERQPVMIAASVEHSITDAQQIPHSKPDDVPSIMMVGTLSSTAVTSQEDSMTVIDSLMESFPSIVVMLSFCLRLLIPSLIFLGFILLLSYGIQVMCWGLALARDSVRDLVRGERPSFPLLTRSWSPHPIPVLPNRSVNLKR